MLPSDREEEEEEHDLVHPLIESRDDPTSVEDRQVAAAEGSLSVERVSFTSIAMENYTRLSISELQHPQTTLNTADDNVSDDEAQQQQQPLSSKSHLLRETRKILTKFWLLEAASCAFSLLCLVSIVGVLSFENGKPLDQWTWPVSPTAVVSFIATMAKASVVLVLGQLLSQLKWLYFREGTGGTLRGLRTFDSGSRGPLGAVMVVWSSKKLLASVAASLMVLAILIDPFIQLVFSFEIQLVPDASQQAVFQQAYEWTQEDDSGLWDMWPPVSMWSSTYRGFESADTTLAALCSSGTCTWNNVGGPIQTLGVCASCSDVTSAVAVNCSSQYQNVSSYQWKVETCDYTFSDHDILSAQAYQILTNFSLDGNRVLTYRYTQWNSSTTARAQQRIDDSSLCFQTNITETYFRGKGPGPIMWYSNETYPNASAEMSTPTICLGINDTTIVAFNAIQIEEPPFGEQGQPVKDPPSARCWSCEMKWCERTYENLEITSNGDPMYTVSTRPLLLVDGSRWSLEGPSPFIELPPSAFYSSDLERFNGSSVWEFYYSIDFGWGDFIGTFFDSYYIQASGGKEGSFNLSTIAGSSLPLGQEFIGGAQSGRVDLKTSPVASVGLVTSNDLNATINRLAGSLTETIRTGAAATNVSGEALVAKTFIRIRWQWLILPLALMVITCLLLPVVAVKSQSENMAVWKDDPLALLFHRVEACETLLPEKTSGSTDLDELANEVYVRLDQEKPFTFVGSQRRKKTSWVDAK